MYCSVVMLLATVSDSQQLIVYYAATENILCCVHAYRVLCRPSPLNTLPLTVHITCPSHFFSFRFLSYPYLGQCTLFGSMLSEQYRDSGTFFEKILRDRAVSDTLSCIVLPMSSHSCLTILVTYNFYFSLVPHFFISIFYFLFFSFSYVEWNLRSGIPRSPSMLSKPGVTATSSSSSSLSSSLNPKYKRDFLYQNNEDPGRHLETFNNTGLNASSSDSQICPKQSKGFRNTRSSIIHENNQNNMSWRSNYDNNDSRERERDRDRDRGDKDKGAKNERERTVVKNGTDATRSNNNNNSNGNSSKADNKKLSKKDKDSNNGRGIMKEEGYYNGSGDLEVERGNTKQQSNSAQKKKTGLNMIWAASAVSGDVSPTDEGVSEVVVERDCLNDIVVESDKSKRERSSPFFLGSSYNNSSSNTINIGLNIEISTSDQSLLSKGEAKKREIENTTSHFDCNGASTSDTPNGTNTMTEDDIDNDDDETDDVFVMDADIPFSEAGVTRKPSHTQSHSAAVACTGTTTGTIDNESEGSNSGDNVTEISDSADVSDNGSVNMDPKKSSSVPSSSRLLSSNPSFPARPPSSLSASSSLFASNPSSRLPPIGPVGGKKDKHKPACYFGTPGIFQRLCITALAHPFLVVSVKMVTNPELRNQNWIYSYVHIVTRSGFGGLYSGIR